MELSADQQMHLLNNDPTRFGNLNGIPAKDREKANRFVLKNEVHQIEAALKAAGLPTTIDPKVLEKWDSEGQHGLILSGKNPVRDAITNAGISFDQAKHTLRVNQQLTPDDGTDPSLVHLLAYEPGADDENGRAALAYGDVDGAENVAVCVPGLNSTLGNFENVSGDARKLFKAAKATDPSKQTAVIAWQGYDAPNFHEVADQGHAEVGSKLLAADVNALRVTHDGPIEGKLTVVGHSYGSTVTGLALQREHLIVDQVALIGSPGVGGGAQTAAALGLDKNTLFVGADSRDIVTTGTREFFHTLGADPTLDDFNRGDHINFADHSLYYDVDTQSESLHGLSRIVTGYGDTLRQEGMLAAPRHTVPPVPGNPYSHARVDDGEGNRTPTPGHANTPVNP
jgi:pimeloyl-ACP methyl ester carboxylesterase